MSDKLMKEVWTHFPGGGPELAVLLAIAEAANEKGNCYPSLEQLARLARVSKSSTFRAVKALRLARWILTNYENGDVSVYQINLLQLRRSARDSVPADLRPWSLGIKTSKIAPAARNGSRLNYTAASQMVRR